MKLFITRHGETKENKAGIIQGHLPGNLSELGKQQAANIAQRLQHETLNHIYSSDLTRAADTATSIAAFHPETPLEFTRELRELFLGEWQGKSKAELNLPHEATLYDIVPKNRETLEEMYLRAKRLLNFLLKKHPQQNILLVGHNGINKALITVIMEKKWQDIPSIAKQHNTNLTVFELDGIGKYQTILLNNTDHLR